MCAWAWSLNVSVRNLLQHDSRTGDRASPGHHHLRCQYKQLLSKPVRHNTPHEYPDYLINTLFLRCKYRRVSTCVSSENRSNDVVTESGEAKMESNVL